MDDIFVIILTLIIAVVGALNQKRKKKRPQSTPVEGGGPQPKQDIWDMLFDQEEEPAVPIPTEYDYIEEEPVEEKKPVFESSVSKTAQPKYEFKAQKEGVSVIRKEDEKVIVKKKKFIIEGEEFSLKKAVIYSEILNKKYS